MHIDTANRFQSYVLTEEEERAARTVSPYTLAYLQNKLSLYANQVVNSTYHDSRGEVDSERQTLLRHERLKAQVEVLEELFMEFNTQEIQEDSDPSQGELLRPGL